MKNFFFTLKKHFKISSPVVSAKANIHPSYFSVFTKSIFCSFMLLIFFFSTELAFAGLKNETLNLSLDEAILLAVRNNPNVQSSRLSYISQKFNLWVQEWEFYPHYSLEAAANFYNNSSKGQPRPNSGFHNYNVQPTISLQTPIGTSITLAGTNSQTLHYNPGLSLQVMQPLLRGFGSAIVEASLNNTKDSLVISRLSIENVLRTTVSNVVNAYLSVVSAQKTISIDEDALKRAEKSLEQTRLFIKAGHKAGNELVTVQANVASAKTSLENDKNNLMQTRYALLAAIGLDPNANISFANLDIQNVIKKYHLLSLASTKKLTLENNIQYQTDQITLHGEDQRSLLSAQDNMRWQLNLMANASTGNASGGGQFAGINSLINGVNETQNIGLTLKIPIDDQPAKQALQSAKIALKQAELALMQEKWSSETNAINAWNTVESAARALRFAVDAEKLQEKTYQVNFQKYLHGLIDSLELQSAQASYVQAQQASLNARMNYLKALVSLDQLIGSTLQTWKIEVRV
jgi:outer membrane protein